MAQIFDVTFQDIEEVTRMTFVTKKAKETINNEPAIAGYIETKDDVSFLDIAKDEENKNQMIAYLISHDLSSTVLQ